MDDWQRVIADLLWRASSVRELTEAVAEEAARGLVSSRLAERSPGRYYDGIERGLASGALLTGSFDGPHGEEQFREFLDRVRARMDELRPWPEPPFVQLPVVAWARFGAGRAIGRVRARFFDLERQLLLVADPLPGDDRRRVLMLRPRDGAEVAIVGSPGDTVLTVIRRPAEDDGPGRTAAPGPVGDKAQTANGGSGATATPGTDDDAVRAAFTAATGVPVEGW